MGSPSRHTYAARDPAHIVFKLFKNARRFFFLFRLMTSPKFTNHDLIQPSASNERWKRTPHCRSILPSQVARSLSPRGSPRNGSPTRYFPGLSRFSNARVTPRFAHPSTLSHLTSPPPSEVVGIRESSKSARLYSRYTLYPELTDLSLSSLLLLHPRSTQIPDVASAVTDNQFHIPSHEGLGLCGPRLPALRSNYYSISPPRGHLTKPKPPTFWRQLG
jgi:hypothetical protein